MSKEVLLYSINTVLAFRIQCTYYDNIHFVWCTDKYDHGTRQPASSNPLSIAQSFIQDVYSKDKHSAIIRQNREGLKRGAMFKRKNGVIDEETESEIIALVNAAEFDQFLPLLYVIPYSGVSSLCECVPRREKASYNSIEYRIQNLPRSAFDLLDLGRTLPTILGGELEP